MVTIFATLGYVPQSVLPSLRTAGVEELVVFASTKEKKVEAAVSKVRSHCEKADIPFRRVRVTRPYDLEYVARVISDNLQKYKDREVIFNITGGTKVMAAAALVVCFIRGIPTEYAQERTMEVIRLPLMKIETGSQLTKKQKDIVRYLLKQKDQTATTTRIKRALDMKKSTLSTHISKLKAKGLVTVEPVTGGRGNLVRAIPSLRILMMDMDH
jgi:CRISPR locus-related DNA-binding protein